MKLLHSHGRSIILAISRIISNPFEHLLNIMVITLLSSMLGGVLVINYTNNQWQTNNITYPQITVYLAESASNKDVSKIETTINNFSHNIIKNYQYISKDQGLAELKNDMQTKNITSDIVSDTENPLPNVIIINTNTVNVDVLNQLTRRVSNSPFVTSVQMDEKYALKVGNLINFIKKISNVLLVFFGLSLILTIYNLIRLQMLEGQDEITVSRLIGASDGFIMRPLAYYAIIQMIIAAGASFVLINRFINYLNNLFSNLNNLFGNTFTLIPLSYTQLGEMLVTLIVFTIFAVFIAVQTVFRKNHSQ
jgi:cell division transport system permease protein